MAKKPKDLRTKSDPAVEPDDSLLPDRNEELRDDEDIRHTALELMKDVEKSFDDQAPRVNEGFDNWDLYNCKLTSRQFYNGQSKNFVPLVHDAVNARNVRFTNQIFPQPGRHVEVTTEDGEVPNSLMALLDYYIRRARLRTEVMPALMRAGDCEGQYTIYVDWEKLTRHVVWRGEKEGQPPGHDLPNPVFSVEDIIEEEITSEGPVVEVIQDADFTVTPATARSLGHALAVGGAVTVIRRWSKAKIQSLVDEGKIDKDAGADLIKEMSAEVKTTGPGSRDPAKHSLDAAGIKKDGRGKYAQVYETWAYLVLEEGKRLCRIYYAGTDRVLSVRRNPYWSDRLPIFSVPVRKVPGSFKGAAPVSAVADFQVIANDAMNQGMDAATYALVPIIMTDPLKNPRVGSMILSPAAIWETSPNDTSFAQFPPLWKDALEIVASARQQVIQTLGVNPASITQAVGKKKLNQAEIAQEQQIDILVTADAVTVLEEGILTPFLEFCIELDHQYREDSITVREFGEMGQRAKMDRIEPIQMHKRWQFRWFGVEQARSAQQIQQQISLMNVIRGIPPQMYPGYSINAVPLMLQIIESAFGPRLAPLVFKDERSHFAEDPQGENPYLFEGLYLPAHELDNHMQHMQVHAQALQHGDPHGMIRKHMMQHQIMMNAMQQQKMAQQQPQQGGGQKQGPKGQPSGTKPGGAPSGQMPGGQGPPGAIHPDQMHGTQAPRR